MQEGQSQQQEDLKGKQKDYTKGTHPACFLSTCRNSESEGGFETFSSCDNVLHVCKLKCIKRFISKILKILLLKQTQLTLPYMQT